MASNKRTSRRYVYLIERVSGRSSKSVLRGQREVKIGIAKDVDRRLREINNDLPGRWVVYDAKRVGSASRVEKQLHQEFKDHQFTVSGGKPGSGQTECHRVTTGELRAMQRSLHRAVYPADWKVFLIIVLVAYLAVKYLHQHYA